MFLHQILKGSGGGQRRSKPLSRSSRPSPIDVLTEMALYATYSGRRKADTADSGNAAAAAAGIHSSRFCWARNVQVQRTIGPPFFRKRWTEPFVEILCCGRGRAGGAMGGAWISWISTHGQAAADSGWRAVCAAPTRGAGRGARCRGCPVASEGRCSYRCTVYGVRRGRAVCNVYGGQRRRRRGAVFSRFFPALSPKRLP